MSVLLTRASEDNRRIAGLLALPADHVLCWPMSSVQLLPFKLPAPDVEALLFTSANGVAGFIAGTDRRNFAALCVGDRTAKAAREAGFIRIQSAAGTAEDLVRLSTASGFRHLLYARGREISTDLAGSLSAAGLRVDQATVYEMRAQALPPGDVLDALRSGHVTLVTVWSQRAARTLTSAIEVNPDWQLEDCDLLAISQRAADAVDSAHFRSILVASRPDAQAMIEAVRAAVRQKNG